MTTCPNCHCELPTEASPLARCVMCGFPLQAGASAAPRADQKGTTPDIQATITLPASTANSTANAVRPPSPSDLPANDPRKTVEMDQAAQNSTVDFANLPAANPSHHDPRPRPSEEKDEKKTVEIPTNAISQTVDISNLIPNMTSPAVGNATVVLDQIEKQPPSPNQPVGSRAKGAATVVDIVSKDQNKTVEIDRHAISQTMEWGATPHASGPTPVGGATMDFAPQAKKPPSANANSGAGTTPPDSVTFANVKDDLKGKDEKKTVEIDRNAMGSTVDFSTISNPSANDSNNAALTSQDARGATMDLGPDRGKKTKSNADGMATLAHPSALGRGSHDDLQTMWGKSIEPSDRPEMTMKSSASAANTVINVVIQSRKFESTGAVRGGTADYELIEMLGEGGVGVVFAARQASIDRTVAIKMLKGSLSNDASHRSKFLSEAVVTGDLDHPNIVPIYDLGSNNSGALFYSMKRVRGTPWSKVIRQKPLTENLSILMSVADAVAFAHARGVLHRDLKPENVMLGDFGEVLVMDWGIALSTPEYPKHAAITQTASMGGTPVYMAPEMATGPLEKITASSDVYLLGAILYEIITGKAPHTGKDVMGCIYAAMKNEIQPTEQSGELLEIAYKAMATLPEDRYASVQDFQRAIREYQSHSESIALSARADEELTKAKTSQDYRDFSRAVFAFEEAAILWDGNTRAKEGVKQSQLAYAGCALDKGDFDLGISLLDNKIPAHAALHEKLSAAQQEREARKQRLKNLRRIAGALALTVFAVVTLAFFWIRAKNLEVVAKNHEVVEAYSKLEVTNKELTSTTEQLKVSEGNLRIEKVALEENQRRLRIEKKRADDAAEESRMEAQRAREAQQREALATYLAQIGLSAERIATNSFLDAERLLTKYVGTEDSYFRHWEWGHLRYLCQLDRETMQADSYVESVASARQGGLIVAGTASGAAIIWQMDWEKFDSQPRGQARRELTRVDHGGPINAVALSSDGKWLATGGELSAGEIKLWEQRKDGKSFRFVRSLNGHRDGVSSLAFSPDGQSIVSGSRDETARLWDVNTGTQKKAFRGHFGAVWSVTFAPGAPGRATQIATAGDDATVRVWDAASDGEPRIFRGHRQAVFAVAFDPTGHYIASSGRDKDVLVWEWEHLSDFDFKALENRLKSENDAAAFPGASAFRHEPVYRLAGHTAEVRSVAFSDDGKFVLSAGNDNCIRQWKYQAEKSSSDFVATFRGHGGWVRSCVFSPSSRYFVSGGRDEQVKIWDGPSYEEVRTLRGHEDVVLWAAYSPNGKHVATAGRDRRAILWNSETGAPVKHLDENLAVASAKPQTNEERRHVVATLKEGHEFLVTSAAFFPKGGRLLTSAGDNTVRMWDVTSGGELRRFDGTGNVGALSVSNDGRWILTGSDSNNALLWQTDDLRKPPIHLTGHESAITAVALSQSSDKTFPILFTGDALGRGKLWRYDPSPGEWTNYVTLSAHIPGFGITAARFLPGNQHLLTASHDHAVFRWDVTTGKREQEILKHPDAVKSLDLSADGRSALTLCSLGKSTYRVYLWDLEKGTERHIDPDVGGGIVTMVSFHQDQKSAILTATAGTESSIWRWDLASGRFSPMWPANSIRGTVWSTISSPDGEYLLAVGGSQARLLKSKNGEQALSFRPHSAIVSIDYSRSGKLVATGGADGDIKFWVANESDPDFGKVKFKIPHAHEHDGVIYSITSVAFAPTTAEGDTWLLSAGDDGTARLWDISTGVPKSVAVFFGHRNRVRNATFSPDARYVLTTSDDSTARLWDSRTGKSMGTNGGQLPHPSVVLAAKFSSDGQFIISGSDDNIGRIWNVSSLTHGQSEPILLKGHTAAITSVAFSPDGRRAITASQDGMAKLWDTATATEVLSLKRHSAEVTSVHFSPNGRNILTSSRDGTSLIWPSVNITPSLYLTRVPLEYKHAKVPMVVAPAAQVVDPDSSEFADGTLTVEILGESRGNAQQMLAIQTADGPIGIDQNTVTFAAQGAKPTKIATLKSDSDGTNLKFQLEKQIGIPALEALLQAITYQSQNALDKPLQIRFSLREINQGKESVSTAIKTVLPALIQEVASPGTTAAVFQPFLPTSGR